MPNQRPDSSVREIRPIHIIGITVSLRSFAMADIRALSAARRQTIAEDLLRESRDQR